MALGLERGDSHVLGPPCRVPGAPCPQGEIQAWLETSLGVIWEGRGRPDVLGWSLRLG